MKDNAPCNNQPKEPKERKTKKDDLPPRKLSPKKGIQRNQEATELPRCLQKNRKQQIPHVPPKEQEATNSPRASKRTGSNKIPTRPLKPIHSQ
jgi:hypothetical protein